MQPMACRPELRRDMTAVATQPQAVIRIPPRTLIARAIRRDCPICGSGDIWTSWMALKDRCPTCGYEFFRESGYFLGSMAMNIIFSEFAVMALMIVMLASTDMVWWKVELIIIALALLVPIVTNPFFKGLWMAFDLTAHPVREMDVNLDRIPAAYRKP